MPTRPPTHRLAWPALVAVVAVLWSAGEASACAGGPTPKRAAACCSTRAVACVCCEAPAAPASVFQVAATVDPPDRLADAARSCACRSSEQPAPAEPSPSRAEESRPDRAAGAAFALPAPVLHAPAEPERPAALRARVPGPPLYLLTSRLNF